ncbi:MAG: radical SAM protein, partial [Elusimicrobiales bacterium]|nr:radical SAM protein [Elusimicrobiales bacterium]
MNRYAAERLELLPASLEIYVTSACNMRCGYCSSSSIVSGPARRLPAERLKRGIDLFASYCAPRAAAAAGGDPKFRVIGLTGGEPLLEFDAVAAAVEHVRKNYKWLSVTVSTNGLLLDRKKARFLLDRGVDLTVSLDGPRRATDSQRAFVSGGGSVFAAVMRNLSGLPSSYLRRMRVMATFTPDTAPDIARSVRFLRGLGFAAVEADLDMYADWTARDLARLRAGLARLRGLYLRGFGGGEWTSDWGDIFGGALQNKVRGSGPYEAFHEFSLSCDGWFYPADVPSLFGPGPGPGPFAVGGLEEGVDFPRLKEYFDGASAVLSRRPGPGEAVPPACRYFNALARDRSPAAAMDGFYRLSALFGEELGGLLRLERVFRRLARSRDFGDFAHRPRFLPRLAAGSLSVTPAAGLGAARR